LKTITQRLPSWAKVASMLLNPGSNHSRAGVNVFQSRVIMA
jgi:hypothetical protein